MNQAKFDSIIERLRDEESRWDAILELKLIHEPEWVTQLIELLDDHDWVIRWCVAETLGDLGDPAAIKPLLKTLDDPDFHVFKNTYKSLERFSVSIIPPALPYFSHSNQKVRQAIFNLIHSFGDDAVPVLEKELNKYGWIISNRIIHLIWQIGGKASEDILIHTLSNKAVRKNATVMLGMLGSKRALVHLIKAFEEPGMRRVVLISMKLIGKKIAFPVIIQSLNNEALAKQSETLILKVKKPMLPYLVQALGQSGYNKKSLVALIEKIGAETVMPKLHVLAEKHSDVRVVTRKLRSQYPSETKKSKKGLFGFFNA